MTKFPVSAMPSKRYFGPETIDSVGRAAKKIPTYWKGWENSPIIAKALDPSISLEFQVKSIITGTTL